MAASPLILWFRDDLRVTDHPALHAAAKTGRPIIALFILEPDSRDFRAPGAASRWWLANSLREHAKNLKALGVNLTLKRGDAWEVLSNLAQETAAAGIYWTRRYGRPETIDRRIADRFRKAGLEVRAFGGTLLHEPEEVLTNQGKPFRVFTPFMRAAQQQPHLKSPLIAPRNLVSFRRLESDRIEDWKLEPKKPDWAAEMQEAWVPGEDGGHQRLHHFLADGVKGYAAGRDRLDEEHVSRLSPHLRFGEISPRQILHVAQLALDRKSAPPSNDIEKFITELYWREFSYHLLHYNSDLSRKNFQPRFDAFPWRKDEGALKAWQCGRTGYPIVDAGMRQLWRTGWMHNRARMITASFLIKHLLIDWREGEAWFWDTLVDADPANNAASWQWVAGSGADAAPYFRIFNPVTQGQKFDPHGVYVRTFVPELAKAPDADIHAPREGSKGPKAASEVQHNDTYPEPIVDHALARRRALKAFEKTKS